jgi:hypothetical protein
MVGEVLTLPQLREGVFIGGENLAIGGSTQQQSSDKFGSAGLWAGRPDSKSDGTGFLAGCPTARREDPAPRRKPIQYSRLVAPPGWFGLPPDGPAREPARPT